MSQIAIGTTVRAEMHDGTIEGEITGINNRKITIQAERKRISENGQQLVVESDEEVTIFQRNVVGIVSS